MALALVSVVMPLHNARSYLQASIESITGQTEHDLELLIVDDGSTDGSFELARTLATADPRIHVAQISHSGGPSRPRNEGLRQATGQFIAFQDADDISHRERFARELDVFKRFPRVEFVFHDFAKFDEVPGEAAGSRLQELDFVRRAGSALTDVGDRVYETSLDFYRFLSLDVPVVWTGAVMLRKELLGRDGAGFREDLRIGEDYDLWFRLIHGHRGAFINEVLAYYRRHGSNITGDEEQMLLGGIRLHEANLSRGRDVFSPGDVRRYHRKIADLWFHLASYYQQSGRTGAARSGYLQVLKHHARWRAVPRCVWASRRRFAGSAGAILCASTWPACS